MLTLEKFSLGVGDRFAHQAKPSCELACWAAERGADVIPVWNKSNREHGIVGSEPASVRAAADAAVRELGLEAALPRGRRPHQSGHGGPLPRRQRFLHARRGRRHRPARRAGTASRPSSTRHPELVGRIEIPGIERAVRPPRASRSRRSPASTCSPCRRPGASTATSPASAKAHFITEVSMDETDAPQTPPELLVILAAIADERIPIQTIAPKFTGRFNKGVDYVGDVAQFEKEFSDDLAVIALRRRAVRPARQPEAERAFRQRQVLDLRADSPRARASSAPASTSRPRAPPGWRN